MAKKNKIGLSVTITERTMQKYDEPLYKYLDRLEKECKSKEQEKKSK